MKSALTRLVGVTASLLLAASASFASTVWECKDSGGCTASWRQPDGTWDERSYEKGQRIIVGDDDSVELGNENWDLIMT